jgi:hypothetical protein
MKTLFSAFAASELLEKDRQTIVRALRNTKPDGQERGQPRWKMSTIVTAMERHNRANGGDNGTTGANPPEFAVFDLAFDKLEALPTLAARRKRAVQLVPLIDDMITALRTRGREAGEGWEVTGIRGDRVYQLTLAGFQGPCQWSHDQVWTNLNVDDGAD